MEDSAVIGGALIYLLIIGIISVGTIVALIDAIMHAKNKILWALIIFFFGLLGAIAWWIAGERENKSKARSYRAVRRPGATSGRPATGGGPARAASPRGSGRPMRRRTLRR